MKDEYRVGFEAISPLSIEELSREFYDHFDGTLAEHCGRISVFVYGEGQSAYQVATTTIPKLEKIGFSIVRTDPDLVDGPEIAERLGVTRQAVQNWAKGTRGSSFPHPVGLPGGRRIWTWNQVVEWAKREHRTSEPQGLDQDSAAMVDAMLARRRHSVAASPVFAMDSMIDRGSVKSQAGATSAADYPRRQLRSVS